jgi:hypothetical protein
MYCLSGAGSSFAVRAMITSPASASHAHVWSALKSNVGSGSALVLIFAASRPMASAMPTASVTSILFIAFSLARHTPSPPPLPGRRS